MERPNDVPEDEDNDMGNRLCCTTTTQENPTSPPIEQPNDRPEDEIQDEEPEAVSHDEEPEPEFHDEEDDYDYEDDNSFHEEQEGHPDIEFNNEVITGLNDSDLSTQLAALTELCTWLSFSEEYLISPDSMVLLTPALVKLAKHETSPDIMLVAIRAITYLCDASPPSGKYLVRHGVVAALTAPLMAIEYLDVAEQCLEALERISRDSPLECLLSGVIMSILNFMDFFSTSVQRVGIAIIANICREFPLGSASQVIEAAPVLCNLLNYEDEKIVENVAACLISIVNNVKHSSETLDELCKHGLVHQVADFIISNNGKTANQRIYNDLIGLLSQLASGSVKASNSLFELNIGSTLKHILVQNKPSLVDSDAHHKQIYAVVKLLNVLLPTVSNNAGDDVEVSDKKKIITDQPELLQQFGADLLPVLIQVVYSGIDLHVCYGCLYAIYKIVYLSKSDMLVDLLNNSNFSSFLAGLIAQKDDHVLMLALKIVKTVMQELPGAFSDVFVKEGVVYAIDALITPEKGSKFMSQVATSTKFFSRSEKKDENEVDRCLCYAYDADYLSSLETKACKIEADSVQTLAKHVMSIYSTSEPRSPDCGLTNLKRLRIICDVLTSMVSMNVKKSSCEQEKKLTHVLSQLMDTLNGEEPVSTFEFIESGVTRTLIYYISNGCYQKGKVDARKLSGHLHVVQKRYEVFSRCCLSSTGQHGRDMPLAKLIRKLQNALSLLENFPVCLQKSSDPEEANTTVLSESSITRKPHGMKTWNPHDIFRHDTSCFSSMLLGELPNSFKNSSPMYDILVLLKILDVLNRSASHILCNERNSLFAEGNSIGLDSLMVTVCKIPQTEFISLKLTEKVERQMKQSSVVPSCWVHLMETFPFLFGFEIRSRYFQLTLSQSVTTSNDGRLHASKVPRSKFEVNRSQILESAAKMMASDASRKATLEVEYPEEVGTGLGPTVEFFTLVSQEFQKIGLGMWREDQDPSSLSSEIGSEVRNPGYVVAPCGLFPRPCPPSTTSKRAEFSEIIQKFSLLGKVVAKALKDGRVLDLPLSVNFYKLILEQGLNLYDIHSFDPALGKTLVEFRALVDRNELSASASKKGKSLASNSYFHDTQIEDLCLDFTLPGYPDYLLSSAHAHKMVNISNLKDYLRLTARATLSDGISRQVEAFKSGFNKVFPLRSLQIFTAEEIDQLLCGEQNAWNHNELLDNIKFDHGYTASSPPIVDLLELMQELECSEQRAFLQFVTGAPRLPPGGLAALTPKLTIVRKHCKEYPDGELPSVMTCANYLKLPPYSCKEIMRERVLYAITEGQGSFHLS